jgi:hypothetical protein
MSEASGGLGCRCCPAGWAFCVICVQSGVIVDVSSLPLKCALERFSLMIVGAWISRKASVASLPAYLRITADVIQPKVLYVNSQHSPEGPPGCSLANAVKSQTSPWMTTQQSSGALWERISCTERSGISLLSLSIAFVHDN